MISIEIVRRCYICGEETLQRWSICKDCQSEAVLIGHPCCRVCGLPLVSEGELCLHCRERDFSFVSNRSLFEYKSMARDILYQYKFEGQRDIAFWYAGLMEIVIQDDYPGYIIVPSPTNLRKKLMKGWDQVEHLCRYLNKNKKIEIANALKKRPGKDQKELDHKGRMLNMKGRIVPQKGIFNIRGRKVLLVDDVFTTGATAHECASVLLENGAIEVVSLTIAID